MIRFLKKVASEIKFWWVLPVYGVIYMILFYLVEHRTGVTYTILQVPLDTIIPFCEYFIIPYELWFVCILATGLFLLLVNRDPGDYYRFSASMIIGMSIFIAVSFIFPNMQVLRPHYFAHDNIFVDMVKSIYAADTSTNIFPSIHVYNSMVMYFALKECKMLKGKKLINAGVLLMAISIILSTMFLKQHSALDVTFALVLNFAVYATIYQPEKVTGTERRRAGDLLSKKA